MLPSASSVTRLSGRGRSSVESQKSTACRATSLERARRGELGLERLLAAVHRRPSTCRPSGCCPAGTRSRRCRSRSRSGRASSGRRSGSLPWRGRARPGCCGRCSCARPGRSRWPGRSGACRWPRRAAAWPSWPRRTRRRRCRPANVSLRRRRARSTTSVTAVPAAIGVQRHRLGVGHQRDVGVLQRRPDPEHLGVGLGVHEAGEAVARRAANAGAVGHVALVEHAPRRARGRAGCPAAARSSASCWIRGSWETAGKG